MQHIPRQALSKVIKYDLKNLSIAVTKLYNDNFGLFNQLSNDIIDGRYDTAAIYLFKRRQCFFDRTELIKALMSLKGEIHFSLYQSFRAELQNREDHKFTMYLVKNKRVEYYREQKIENEILQYDYQLSE